MSGPAGATPDDAFLRRYDRPGTSGLPKYAQLRETLYAAIKAGHWKAGERLPTETELTQLTRVSLGTVQRALRELAGRGVVVRQHGSGTYVADGRGSIDAPLHLRFRGREGEPTFLPLFPKALRRHRMQAEGRWSAWLRQRGDNIVCIERLLGVNREFAIYSRFFFDADTFPTIAARPLRSLDGANLKQMLGDAIAEPITDIEQQLSFVRFGAEAAAATGAKVGTRGLLLESAAAAGRRRHPLYFLESYIPPNDRQLDFSTSPSGGGFERLGS